MCTDFGAPQTHTPKALAVRSMRNVLVLAWWASAGALSFGKSLNAGTACCDAGTAAVATVDSDKQAGVDSSEGGCGAVRRGFAMILGTPGSEIGISESLVEGVPSTQLKGTDGSFSASHSAGASWTEAKGAGAAVGGLHDAGASAAGSAGAAVGALDVIRSVRRAGARG